MSEEEKRIAFADFVNVMWPKLFDSSGVIKKKFRTEAMMRTIASVAPPPTILTAIWSQMLREEEEDKEARR